MSTDLSLGAIPRGQSPLLWESLRVVIDRVPSDRPARVLDCGGGTGSLAVPLAVLGADVTVVDVSIDALGTLTRRANESGVSERVTAVQGEAETLPSLVALEHFDLVLAHELLDDVADVGVTLSGLAAVLRLGGTASIVITNPVANLIGRALAGDVAGALELARRPRDELSDLVGLTEACAQAGLPVIASQGLGVFAEIVPGIDLERPGAMAALIGLEAETADRAPYRDIAARLHVLAERPRSD